MTEAPISKFDQILLSLWQDEFKATGDPDLR
jgi:hypothetical protein